jgi:hypothetical protein
VRYRLPGRALFTLLALSVVLPVAASATITPSLTITSSPLSAGATQDVSFGLTFSPMNGDYPTTLSLALPAGLLLDANLNAGACVSSAAPMAGCALGTGT